MKEVIAYKDRTMLYLVLVLCLATVATSINLIVHNSEIKWLGILGLCVAALAVLEFGAMLCFPKTAIVKEGDNLIIYNDLRPKKMIAIADVKAVRLLQKNPKGKEIKSGSICLTVQTETGEKDIGVNGTLKDVSEVIDKINALIGAVSPEADECR